MLLKLVRLRQILPKSQAYDLKIKLFLNISDNTFRFTLNCTPYTLFN